MTAVVDRYLTGAACRQLPAGEADRIFFPTTRGPRTHHAITEARELCRSCPVRGDCLMLALELWPPPIGIWGGATEQERARMRHHTTKGHTA